MSTDDGELQAKEALKAGLAALKEAHFDESKRLLEFALALLESLYDAEHPGIAACLQGLGDSCYHLEEYSEAARIYTKLFMMEKNAPPAERVTTLLKLANSYDKAKMYNQATIMYQQAIACAEQKLPQAHHLTLGCLERFAQMLREGLQQTDQAMKVEARLAELKLVAVAESLDSTGMPIQTNLPVEAAAPAAAPAPATPLAAPAAEPAQPVAQASAATADPVAVPQATAEQAALEAARAAALEAPPPEPVAAPAALDSNGNGKPAEGQAVPPPPPPVAEAAPPPPPPPPVAAQAPVAAAAPAEAPGCTDADEFETPAPAATPAPAPAAQAPGEETSREPSIIVVSPVGSFSRSNTATTAESAPAAAAPAPAPAQPVAEPAVPPPAAIQAPPPPPQPAAPPAPAAATAPPAPPQDAAPPPPPPPPPQAAPPPMAAPGAVMDAPAWMPGAPETPPQPAAQEEPSWSLPEPGAAPAPAAAPAAPAAPPVQPAQPAPSVVPNATPEPVTATPAPAPAIPPQAIPAAAPSPQPVPVAAAAQPAGMPGGPGWTPPEAPAWVPPSPPAKVEPQVNAIGIITNAANPVLDMPPEPPAAPIPPSMSSGTQIPAVPAGIGSSSQIPAFSAPPQAPAMAPPTMASQPSPFTVQATSMPPGVIPAQPGMPPAGPPQEPAAMPGGIPSGMPSGMPPAGMPAMTPPDFDTNGGRNSGPQPAAEPAKSDDEDMDLSQLQKKRRQSLGLDDEGHVVEADRKPTVAYDDYIRTYEKPWYLSPHNIVGGVAVLFVVVMIGGITWFINSKSSAPNSMKYASPIADKGSTSKGSSKGSRSGSSKSLSEDLKNLPVASPSTGPLGETMEVLAQDIEKYYSVHKKYPTSKAELSKLDDKLSYLNPATKMADVPEIGLVTVADDKDLQRRLEFMKEGGCWVNCPWPEKGQISGSLLRLKNASGDPALSHYLCIRAVGEDGQFIMKPGTGQVALILLKDGKPILDTAKGSGGGPGSAIGSDVVNQIEAEAKAAAMGEAQRAAQKRQAESTIRQFESEQMRNAILTPPPQQ